MTGWRLIRREFMAYAFSGDGASLYGGRWNSLGTPVVYLSEHLSLAALELLIRLIKTDSGLLFAAIPVEIPETLASEQLRTEDLPIDWREAIPSPSTQLIGDSWIRNSRTVVLKVPSVVIPSEFNLALNPQHPDFARIKIGFPQPFSFDSRLWK